jgi:hypothetical protein
MIMRNSLFKGGVRVKMGETFEMQFTPPKVDCVCGVKFNDLRLISYKEDNKPQHCVCCRRCNRIGPPGDSVGFAMLSWAGLMKREKMGRE